MGRSSKDTQPRKQYASLDLFSGAGGFSVGLLDAGFRSVGAAEINLVAGRTYARNFPDGEVHLFGPAQGDLTKISPQKLDVLLRAAGISDGGLDLIVAGPPCQGFSRVGRGKIASLNETSDAFLRDPRNRLYEQAIKILRHLRPRAFLFENVAGMLHLRGLNMVEAVCHAVAKSGYVVRCALLNSGWYGVPQTRERVFIIAFRDDLGIEPRFPTITHKVELSRGHLSDAKLDPGNWRNYAYFVPFEGLSFSRSLKPCVTAGAALADLPPFREHLATGTNQYRSIRHMQRDVDYLIPPPNEYCKMMREWNGHFVSKSISDHYCRHTPRDFETFARMKSGDRYPEAHAVASHRFLEAISQWKLKGGKRPSRDDYVPPYSLAGFPDKWKKLTADQPSWTITAHLGKDTYSHIHFDSTQKRMITVREAARLQSFPDAFCFEGNTGDVLHQIGNAVPPLLARAIGRVIHQQLSDLDSRRIGIQQQLQWRPDRSLAGPSL